MAEIVTSATSLQIARTANDIIRSCATAGVATLAREGTSPNILGWLAASTAQLIPRQALFDGLLVSHALEGTWTSPFMANLMGEQQGTTQHALLAQSPGQKLVIYVTAGMLREHLSVTLGLQQVAEVPDNVYQTCVHPNMLQMLQQDVASNLERCIMAFAASDTGNSKAASYRELAVIAIAFAAAQQKGPKHWVRVRNLIGTESLCAALGTAFNADITIGVMHGIIPKTQHLAARVSGKTFLSADTGNQLQSRVGSHGGSPAMSTSIHFEFDTSGVVAIGICETGSPVKDYIVPDGGTRRPSRNTMLAGEVAAIAKTKLDCDPPFPWICKAARGAYILKTLASEMASALEQNDDVACKSTIANLIGTWMATFVEEIGGSTGDVATMRDLLVKAAMRDITEESFERELDDIAGSDEAGERSLHLSTLKGLHGVIDDILIVSLFRGLFGQCYAGLELNTDSLDYFTFSHGFCEMIPKLFRIVPSFDVPVTTYRPFSICCSAVQCSGLVLMPRVLAEEKICLVGTSPFVMVPGRLAMHGVPVKGFFYDEEHGEEHMFALRPNARVPSDASLTDVIDYIYEEADFGYIFRTKEAGYTLNFDELLQGIFFMHSVDDTYGNTAEITGWEPAAPHHDNPIGDETKILYLTYGNAAGRRLALSRAGYGSKHAVVHFGRDYRRAAAYANRFGSYPIIL